MSVDVSRVSRSTMLGKALRLPLRLLPAHLVVPVLQGPLLGARWVVGAGTHGCWFGTYEFEKQRAFAASATRARVVFDIGANVGFYTLLGAVVGGPTAQVFAFEPLPRNLDFLRRHLELNHLGNVRVFPVAVADTPGTVRFDDRLGPSMGKVAAGGTFDVPAVSLDDLSRRGQIADPQLVKIDVEGGEEAVLAGGEALFKRARPTIFLSTHGAEIHERCAAWLRSVGYSLSTPAADELVATP